MYALRRWNISGATGAHVLSRVPRRHVHVSSRPIYVYKLCYWVFRRPSGLNNMHCVCIWFNCSLVGCFGLRSVSNWHLCRCCIKPMCELFDWKLWRPIRINSLCGMRRGVDSSSAGCVDLWDLCGGNVQCESHSGVSILFERVVCG